MNLDRIEILKQYIEDDPSDPFNWYALALEYLPRDKKRSLQIFEKLLIEHEYYIPTYYTAGKLMEECRERDRAVATYQKGISLALKQEDHKTVRELQSALDELLFE